MVNRVAIWISCLYFAANVQAQTDTITFTKISEYIFIEPPFKNYSAFTSLFNSSGDPYMYAACRELGVVTFGVSDPYLPQPVDTIPVTAFGNLLPTNLSQNGSYLFVSLGGFDLIPQNAGLAILDISDPAHPVIMDQWDSVAFNQGAAIAISDGSFAYLGAMDRGVVIFDVNDKSDIQFISSILPDPNFPEPPGLFSVPNARGLALYGEDLLMVANDAGGLRMIDISDKETPVEIGKYANEMIEDSAQSAYNNIVIVDHYAYVPVDMCGLDVVDITDESMETVYWFNPWDCDSSNWVGRPGHTNEIKLFGDDLLFVSGADSEVLAFDISNRELPVLVGEYAHVNDSIVTWAVDVKDQYVSLALVHNETGFPYYSDRGGVQLLEMTIVPQVGINSSEHEYNFIQVTPNPASYQIRINSDMNWMKFEIRDVTGRIVLLGDREEIISVESILSGCYLLSLYDEQGRLSGGSSFIVNRQ